MWKVWWLKAVFGSHRRAFDSGFTSTPSSGRRPFWRTNVQTQRHGDPWACVNRLGPQAVAGPAAVAADRSSEMCGTSCSSSPQAMRRGSEAASTVAA